MNGGMILAGAASRLLPASIPFRFFIGASYFHVVFWLALLFAAGDVSGFIGGLGLPLAALHVATLGILTLSAMGATLQLLPVATRAPIGAVWKAKLIFALIFVGVHVLVAGMATNVMVLLLFGAILCAVAMAVFVGVTGINLWAAPQANIAMAFAWVALAALALLVMSGVLVAFDFSGGFLVEHARLAVSHFVLGIFGFFGLLAFGFSTILLPMFALSPSPARRVMRAVLVGATSAIVLALAAIAMANTILMLAAFLFGLVAAFMHIASIEYVLRKRMRRRLDLAFLFVRIAHAVLVAGLLLGVLLILDVPVYGGWTLFGWVVVAGWLLTFLFGILQRIMPFLASMHVGKARGRPPLLSEIGPERPLRLHASAHGAAVLLIGAGIMADANLLIQAGAAVGFLGSLAFGWFALTVISFLMPRASESASKQVR